MTPNLRYEPSSCQLLCGFEQQTGWTQCSLHGHVKSGQSEPSSELGSDDCNVTITAVYGLFDLTCFIELGGERWGGAGGCCCALFEAANEARSHTESTAVYCQGVFQYFSSARVHRVHSRVHRRTLGFAP